MGTKLDEKKTKTDTASLFELLGSSAAQNLREKKHLLEVDHLDKEELELILKTAACLKELKNRDAYPLDLLRGKHLALTFYENSTRTRTSFSIAATNLGANSVSLDISTSSVQKGESLKDTALTLGAMGVEALVIRHASDQAAENLAKDLVGSRGENISIINAGAGRHAHPTQALLDCLTMQEDCGSLEGKKVTILGDTKYSRVARSNARLLPGMGAKLTICSPAYLTATDLNMPGVSITNNFEEAMTDADFVMVLRIQLERQEESLKIDRDDYIRNFQLNHSRLGAASSTVKILHPGPVNRDLELSSALMDDPKFSLIETQVANGIFIRMAILALLMTDC